MDQLFKALNDNSRRQILDLLKEGDLTAGEISDHFDMTKPSLSHHLDILHRAGLVLRERNGQYITYSLSTSVLEETMSWMLKLSNPRKK